MTQAARSDSRYTYADYLAWPDAGRWELIGGVVYDMSPAPVPAHQAIAVNLTLAIGNVLKGGPCRLLVAPIDLLLPAGNESDDEVESVVQPDLLVTCRPEIIRSKNVRGAPDWIIEILSPATARKDEGIKRDLYRRAGVTEYWLIHPGDRTLKRYRLLDGEYRAPQVSGPEDKVTMPVADEPSLSLAAIFDTGIEAT